MIGGPVSDPEEFAGFSFDVRVATSRETAGDGDIQVSVAYLGRYLLKVNGPLSDVLVAVQHGVARIIQAGVNRELR